MKALDRHPEKIPDVGGGVPGDGDDGVCPAHRARNDQPDTQRLPAGEPLRVAVDGHVVGGHDRRKAHLRQRHHAGCSEVGTGAERP